MYSKYGIQIDTTNFSEEDLQTLCRILEEIHEKRKESERHTANIQRNNSGSISIDCDINDEEFHRLSVKEKALWYENTYKYNTRLENTFQVNRCSNNNSRTKQSHVNRLKNLWEARLNTYGLSLLSNSQCINSRANKKHEKPVGYDSTILNNWREEFKLKYLPSEHCISDLCGETKHLYELKSIENLKTTQAKNSVQTKEHSSKPQIVTSNENREQLISRHLIKPHELGLELSQKRHHNILRSALITNEFMAPPKKIRRLDSKRQLFDNPRLESLQHQLLNQRISTLCNWDEKLNDEAKGNTTRGTLSLDELDLKFRNTVVLDDLSRGKAEEQSRFNTFKSRSTTPRVTPTKTMSNDDINSSRTINFDPNSSVEYPESQSSVDPLSTNSEESLMEIRKRKKKIYRCLNGTRKQGDDYVEVKLNWASDSDAEPKSFQTVTHPSGLNCSHQSNMRTNKKQYECISISSRRPCYELSSGCPESDKSFKFDLHSPKKVISVYTLTAMSTPTSSQSNMDTDHDECSKAPEKQSSSKCTPVISNQPTSTLDGDTYIDQGFETGSNDTQSPTRFRKSDCSIEEHFEHFAICSTPYRLNNKKLQHNMPNSVSPIKVTRTNIEKSPIPESPLAMNASEFWISFGNYTVSLKIHHCPWERLLLLRKVFVQEQITENLDINFGIDKQIFPLHSKSLLLIKELIERLSKKDYASYSYYWFCKGNVWLPFKGPIITTARIRRVFKCLQEFRHENGNQREGHDCLTFGIDNYVFFTSHWKYSKNSSKLSDLNCNDL